MPQPCWQRGAFGLKMVSPVLIAAHSDVEVARCLREFANRCVVPVRLKSVAVELHHVVQASMARRPDLVAQVSDLLDEFVASHLVRQSPERVHGVNVSAFEHLAASSTAICLTDHEWGRRGLSGWRRVPVRARTLLLAGDAASTSNEVMFVVWLLQTFRPLR